MEETKRNEILKHINRSITHIARTWGVKEDEVIEIVQDIMKQKKP